MRQSPSGDGNRSSIGLLLSGGLDSAILLAWLLSQGHRVQPFFIRSGVAWERQEQRAVARLLEALAGPRLATLVVFEMPLVDLYGDHWSITGRGVPDETTPDEAVYLPGRNALLALKPMLWCQMHGIEKIALAALKSNPFTDATPAFFDSLEAALNHGAPPAVSIIRPFADLEKPDVMQLGRDVPLELTFSCIAPLRDLHCGYCNKCAERKNAFRSSGIEDRTVYAAAVADA